MLASASPARLATLRAAGVDPEVLVSGIDESTFSAETASDLALSLAVAKARAVAAMDQAYGADLVIGCDSLLQIAGQTHGKPASAKQAAARWRSMRGSSGSLVTGHCIVEPQTGREVSAVATTVVHFADLSDAEIDAYVACGEPLRVAGAFTIDAWGGAFIAGLEGDPHNVVGISLPLLRTMLQELGRFWPDLWP